MHVVVCTVVHHPADARIFYREITALLDAGHDVTYIAPHDEAAASRGDEPPSPPAAPPMAQDDIVADAHAPVLDEFHRQAGQGRARGTLSPVTIPRAAGR